uniref:Doublecortin domain-containing protein n=1 Tax=Scophthalmus maximus TaxID=52904 RepID=A0A8D3CGX5_SCOMX
RPTSRRLGFLDLRHLSRGGIGCPYQLRLGRLRTHVVCHRHTHTHTHTHRSPCRQRASCGLAGAQYAGRTGRRPLASHQNSDRVPERRRLLPRKEGGREPAAGVDLRQSSDLRDAQGGGSVRRREAALHARAGPHGPPPGRPAARQRVRGGRKRAVQTAGIQPVVHSRIVVSARWKRTTDESCTINVFTNGDVLVPPARIRIPKYTLRSWEHVLAVVTEKVHLRTGAVYRLCTLDGQPVCTSTELENNQRYVAVGAERFKALPYDQCVPRFSMRENNSTESRDVLPPIRKSRHAKDVFPHTGFGADLEHTARGQMKKPAAKPDRTKQPRQVSRNAVLFSTGEGSVFNAQNKRSEIAGAAEVQEDGQLKVDLPIDQVEAKIVEVEYEDGSCSASPCKAPLIQTA